MKVLNKINKGLILTIIVLVILIVYFSNLEKQREKDKPDIRKACEEFIELTDRYSVLPEELQVIQEDISEEEVEQYINQMKNDLANIMVDNKENVNIQKQIVENSLRNGYNGVSQVRTKMTRKIQKISNYQFKDNQVTVDLKNQVEEVVKTTDGVKEYNKNNELDASNDQIILQKVEGKWKVVYANLQFEDNRSYFHDEMERTLVY